MAAKKKDLKGGEAWVALTARMTALPERITKTGRDYLEQCRDIGTEADACEAAYKKLKPSEKALTWEALRKQTWGKAQTTIDQYRRIAKHWKHVLPETTTVSGALADIEKKVPKRTRHTAAKKADKGKDQPTTEVKTEIGGVEATPEDATLTTEDEGVNVPTPEDQPAIPPRTPPRVDRLVVERVAVAVGAKDSPDVLMAFAKRLLAELEMVVVFGSAVPSVGKRTRTHAESAALVDQWLAEHPAA